MNRNDEERNIDLDNNPILARNDRVQMDQNQDRIDFMLEDHFDQNNNPQ
jgi:hypothetical protein